MEARKLMARDVRDVRDPMPVLCGNFGNLTMAPARQILVEYYIRDVRMRSCEKEILCPEEIITVITSFATRRKSEM